MADTRPVNADPILGTVHRYHAKLGAVRFEMSLPLEPYIASPPTRA